MSIGRLDRNRISHRYRYEDGLKDTVNFSSQIGLENSQYFPFGLALR